MTHSEFTKLAGFKVKESYYHHVIEPEYMASDIQEKDEWVKLWKKNGGIQKAYDCAVADLEKIREMNTNQRIAINDAREENFHLRNQLDDVKQKLYNRKVEFNETNDTYCAALKERNDLAYFMLEQSEKSSNSALRAKVIEMIGFKAYIEYKFEHNMAIWTLDREEIYKHL